ncbi:hypothetical protein CYMTET_38961 [Cymbomonas tetramitiformis]|uniref:Uncharacterized protein n=1 Tax=Cymbomonas tetramitiformis TaxID=36881 RepID=A0AAE0CD24_9CHLO|nr:hypothetical protein CYMTET_38961 [Cymbomonas tetramitiformis]
MSVELCLDTVDRQAEDQTFDCGRHYVSNKMGRYEYYVDVCQLRVIDYTVVVPSIVRYGNIKKSTQESGSVASNTGGEIVYNFKEIMYKDHCLDSEAKIYNKVVIKYSTESPSPNGFSDIVLKCVFDKEDNSDSELRSVRIANMMRAASLTESRVLEGFVGWCDLDSSRLCNSVTTPYKIAKVLNSTATSYSPHVVSIELFTRKCVPQGATKDMRQWPRLRKTFLLTVAVMPAFVTTLDLFIPNKNADTKTEKTKNRGRSPILTTQVYTWIASKIVKMLICLTKELKCYPDLKPANVALWSDIHENMQLTFIDLDSLDYFEGRNCVATYPHPQIIPEENGLTPCEPKYVWWSFMCLLVDVDQGYEACKFFWEHAAERRERMVVPPYSLEGFYKIEEEELKILLRSVLGDALQKCLWDTYLLLSVKVDESRYARRYSPEYPLQQPSRVDITISIMNDFLEKVQDIPESRSIVVDRDTKLLRLSDSINAFELEIYNEPPIDATVKPIHTQVLDEQDTLYCVGKQRELKQDTIPKLWWYPDYTPQGDEIKKKHILISNTDDYKYSLANDRPTFQLFISTCFDCPGFLSFENCRIRGTLDGLHVIKRYTIGQLASMDTTKFDVRGEGDDDENFRTSAVLSRTDATKSENYVSGRRVDALDPMKSSQEFYATEKGNGRLVAPGYVYRCMYIPQHKSDHRSYKYNYEYFGLPPTEARDAKLAKSLYLMFKPIFRSPAIAKADWRRVPFIGDDNL